jgi:large subunit ribosomal protein L15
LDTIQALVDSKKLKGTIVKQDLMDNGLVQKNDLVKILGRGELTAKLDITVNAFSASAIAAIEKAGGTTTVLEK